MTYYESIKGSLPGKLPSAHDVTLYKSRRKRLEKNKTTPTESVTKIKSMLRLIQELDCCIGFNVKVRKKDIAKVSFIIENVFDPQRFFKSQADYHIFRYNWGIIKTLEDDIVECDRLFLLTSAEAAYQILKQYSLNGYVVD